MDLPTESSKITGSDSSITMWDAKRLNAQRRGNPMWPYLQQAIDSMGKGSQTAQGLNAVLTSVNKLIDNPNHRLYLLCSGKQCLGLIKVGSKKLFIRSKSGQMHEIEPMCILDFYVHESQQRTGHGRQLYDNVLDKENVQPHQLGYDRPSTKFLSFLRKYFGLCDYVPQSNNFVVFSQYFEQAGSASKGGSRNRHQHHHSSNQLHSSGVGHQHSHLHQQPESHASSSMPQLPKVINGREQFQSTYAQQAAEAQHQRALKAQQLGGMHPSEVNNRAAPDHAAAATQQGSFRRGRSPSPFATHTVLPEPGRRPSGASPDGTATAPSSNDRMGRAPLANQMPPRSQLLNSAPTHGLSSSCYPGSQARPAGSHEVSRMQLANTQRPGVSTQHQHFRGRSSSPNRSGYGFDIITGSGGNPHLTQSVGARSSQQSVCVERPMGRQASRRPF